MARRRSSGGANVSFFAFQDIITAVSGILILIVIFLILMLEQPGLMKVPVEVPNNLTLGELDDLITEATDRIREFEILKLEMAGASESKLRAEIGELRAGLEGKEDPQGKELQEELESVQAKVASLEKKVSELEAEQEGVAGVAEELRGRVDSKADGLAKSKDASQIWLHPGKQEKVPVIIVVGQGGAEIRDFSNPEDIENVSPGAFRAILATSDKEASYFMFFIRPEGINVFRTLANMAQEEGFRVGYQALDAETEIRLIGEGQP
jgi:hypothetical protein